VPRYTSEVEVRKALGIETWRNLSKDTILRFLELLPDVDPELALKLIAQVPEITTLAKSVLEDAAKAHEATLASNARSQEMVHEIHLRSLQIFEAELGKDLSHEDWQRVIDEIRNVTSNARLKDTENKQFLSEQSDKRLTTAALAGAVVVGVVLALARSGQKPLLGAGRLLASSHNPASVPTSNGL
jgi:hypothetical protein